MAHPDQMLAQEQDFFMTDVDQDLSILDALCGIDGDDPNDEGLSEDDDDDSYDAQGVRKKKRARRSRTELNEIEKQRTRRINEQIQSLRSLLEMSGLSTKKDKFSILRNTGEYIKKLKTLLNKSQAQLQTLVQARKQELQQQQLQPQPARPMLMPDTLQDEKSTVLTTREPPHTQYNGPIKVVNRPPITTVDMVEAGAYTPNKNSVDYAVMFKNASIAMAVASLDGKFVDCNCAFSVISGYGTDEILKRSVFDLTPPEDCQELMSIVGKMMESPAESAKHFWKRCCFENRDCYCFVSMWLVRRTSGEPVFFQCAVLPLEDYPATIRGGAPDALPESFAAGATATVNAQGQRTIEAAPSDVVSGVQELLNAATQQGDRVLVRTTAAPLQQEQQSASVAPDAAPQPQQQRVTVPE